MNIRDSFKEWCKQTGRSGGILVGKSIREFFDYYQPEEQDVQEDKEVLIGELTHPFGIKGYTLAEVGHPIFETKDRYVVYLKHPDGWKHRVAFYKDTFTSLKKTV
jgi:hypothetical protein